MKLLLLFIVALIIAIGLAYQVHIDPGYALLRHGTWSIETSVAVLIFAILVAFIALAFLFKILLGIKRTPRKLSKWNKHRVQRRSIRELNKGLLDSAEGNWKRSEKLLTKHVKHSETPLLNYLSAAHAAQSQGAYDRRDEYLLKAGDALPEQGHAIHLTRAKLQFSAGQYEQALATLQQLVSLTPDHPVVLLLLLKTLFKLNDWEAIYKLLPTVKNNRNIHEEEWQALEKQTLTNLLALTLQQNSPNFETIWKSLNKKQKLSSEYLSIYAKHKIKTGEDIEAANLIVKSMKSTPNSSLIELYCQLKVDTNTKVKQLEKWLNLFPSDTSLLNQIAIVCKEQDEINKAASYIEKSLAVKPTSLAFLLLGQTLEEQGDAPEKTIEAYRKGLELATNMTPTDIITTDNTQK